MNQENLKHFYNRYAYQNWFDIRHKIYNFTNDGKIVIA